MKRIISLLIILGVILLCAWGCASCPKETTVELMMTPFGPMVLGTDKDRYSEDKHSMEQFMSGEGWLTLEEWELYIKEQEKAQGQKEVEELKGDI